MSVCLDRVNTRGAIKNTGFSIEMIGKILMSLCLNRISRRLFRHSLSSCQAISVFYIVIHLFNLVFWCRLFTQSFRRLLIAVWFFWILIRKILWPAIILILLVEPLKDFLFLNFWFHNTVRFRFKSITFYSASLNITCSHTLACLASWIVKFIYAADRLILLTWRWFFVNATVLILWLGFKCHLRLNFNF